MNKVNKKGFTIVELVIVLAVIGILAGILIPTFANVIRKSQISADVQLAKNLNTVLATAAAEGRIPTSMYDVLYLENEAGYIIENLNPTNQDYYFAWDSANNKIVYLMDDLVTVFYPEEYKLETSACWITVGTAEEAKKISSYGYNLALENDITVDIELSRLVSVDTLGFKCNGVTFNNEAAAATSSGEAPTVVLTGDFGTISGSIGSASVSTSGSASTVNLSGTAGSAITVGGYVGNLTTSGENVQTNITTTGSVNTVDSVSGGSINVNGQETTVESGASNVSGAVKDAQGRSVITIASKSALDSIRSQVASGNRNFNGEVVVQNEDINLNGIAMTPISNVARKNTAYEYQFQGTYDGNGKSILNFSNSGFSLTGLNAGTNDTSVKFGILQTEYKEATFGLFGSVHNATFKNLNITVSIDMMLDHANQYVGDSVGAICGFCSGDLNTFENCTVNGNVAAYDGVGGLVGRSYATKVKFINCVNYANVTGVRKTGGFCGTCNGVEYENCENRGTITCLGYDYDVNVCAANGCSTTSGYYRAGAGVVKNGSASFSDNGFVNNGTVIVAGETKNVINA